MSHGLPTFRPAPQRFVSQNIRPTLNASASSPTSSSRFAVRSVHGFCSMPPSDILLLAKCPCCVDFTLSSGEQRASSLQRFRYKVLDTHRQARGALFLGLYKNYYRWGYLMCQERTTYPKIELGISENYETLLV